LRPDQSLNFDEQRGQVMFKCCHWWYAC